MSNVDEFRRNAIEEKEFFPASDDQIDDGEMHRWVSERGCSYSEDEDAESCNRKNVMEVFTCIGMFPKYGFPVV